MSELLTLADIAERLGISYELAKVWRQRGKLPEPDVPQMSWKQETIEEWERDRER